MKRQVTFGSYLIFLNYLSFALVSGAHLFVLTMKFPASSAPAPRGTTGPAWEVRGPEQRRARVSLPGSLSTSGGLARLLSPSLSARGLNGLTHPPPTRSSPLCPWLSVPLLC